MTAKPDWRDAAAFAARAHTGQYRKDGETPYVSHVYRVALTVRNTFGCDDPVALCAALLHDTIEDTPTDYDDILEAYGEDVADCVAALTKDMRIREDIRETKYDAGLIAADWRAKIVKLADVLDNLTDATRTRGGRSTSRMIDRCKRALDIARTEDAPNQALARAIDAVEHAIADPDAL